MRSAVVTATRCGDDDDDDDDDEMAAQIESLSSS
jgi:hypothetical protein